MERNAESKQSSVDEKSLVYILLSLRAAHTAHNRFRFPSTMRRTQFTTAHERHNTQTYTIYRRRTKTQQNITIDILETSPKSHA